jgi:hypothetical protein
MTSVGKPIFKSRSIYNPTTMHLSKTESNFYEILTKSKDFNQFRYLMMEFLANRPSVEQANDYRGTGKKYSEDGIGEGFGNVELEKIDTLLGKEEEFDEKLNSIPYIDNIDTLTKSFPPEFKRPDTYEKELLKKDTKQPDLFEGLQIHGQSKGGKIKKTRKNRKQRK